MMARAPGTVKRRAKRLFLMPALLAVMIFSMLSMVGPVVATSHPADLQWTYEVRLTEATRGSFYPLMLADSNDDLHILYVNASQRDTSTYSTTNGIIMYMKMDRLGNIAVEPKAIVNPDYDSYYLTRPAAALGPDDSIHLVWSDSRGNHFRVYYMRLDANGDVLVPEIALNTTEICKYPDVAVDADGNARVVFANWAWGPNSPNIFYSVIDPRGNIIVDNFQVTMTVLASNIPRVAVDSEDYVHIVWVENVNTPFGYSDEVYYSRLNPKGTLDISMQRVSVTALQSTNPDIEMSRGTENGPLVVWESDMGGDMDIYYATLDDPMGIMPERLTSTRSDSLQPTVMTDSSGTVFVVWSEKDYMIVDNSAIWMMYRDGSATGKWSAPKRITNDGLGAFRPALALDGSDDPNIVWEDFREIGDQGHWDLYYIRDVRDVEVAPVAYLMLEDINVTVGEEVFFNGSLSYDLNGWDRVVEYNFSFGDGTWTEWQEFSNSTHVYIRPGEYHARLRVRDTFGVVSDIEAMKRVVVDEEHPVAEMPLMQGDVTAAVVVTTLGIGALTGIIAGTEVGKYKFLTLVLVPLYTRINREKTLDNYIRGQIHGYILARPGCHYNAIKQTLKLNNGTLAYHLRKLEKEEFIKSMRDGMYKRFYPAGMKIDGTPPQLSAMQKRILDTITLNPGISQKEIADIVSISAPAVIYHIGILLGAALIVKRRNGPRVEYRLRTVDESMGAEAAEEDEEEEAEEGAPGPGPEG